MSSKKGFDIFSANKIICKVMGVYRFEVHGFFNHFTWLINLLLLLLESIHLIPSLAYLYPHHNLDDVNEVMAIAFPLIVNIVQYMLLVLQKSLLSRLFGEFEQLIDESKEFLDDTNSSTLLIRNFFSIINMPVFKNSLFTQKVRFPVPH